jgi:hypothetical protein
MRMGLKFPARSLRLGLLLMVSFAVVGLLPLVAVGGESLPIIVDVFPGEALLIKFKFKELPTSPEGAADILFINGGSATRGIIATQVSLHVGNDLVGSYTNTMGNALAIFTGPSTIYELFGPSPANLTALFEGRVAVLEYRPIFDSSAVDPFINYQVTTFTAARGTATDTFVESFPAPDLLSAHVRAVRKESVP